MATSSSEPLPESLASCQPDGQRFFRLRVVATGMSWLLLFVVILYLINHHDFGPAGLPATLAIRFVVETLLFSALAYGAIRTLPFRSKPGLRGSIVLGLWIALVVLSDCLSRLDFGVLEVALAALREAMGAGGILLTVLVYVLALAVPFVPGVEIGLLIIMLFGTGGAMAVYVATIAGLSLAFTAGRLIPERVCARLLNRFGITVPGGQLESANSGSGRNLRQRLLARLVAYRYLSLAVSFNLPGNAVLGGGGGIALLCGASGQFKWYWFVLSVTLAVAPVPVLVMTGVIDVGTLMRLNHAAQNLFGKLVGLF